MKAVARSRAPGCETIVADWSAARREQSRWRTEDLNPRSRWPEGQIKINGLRTVAVELAPNRCQATTNHRATLWPIAIAFSADSLMEVQDRARCYGPGGYS